MTQADEPIPEGEPAAYGEGSLTEGEILAVLNSLPPLTMPHEVADRIDAALAGAALPTATVTPIRRWMVPLTIAAGITVIALAAAALVRAPDTTDVVVAGPVLSSGTDYAPASLAAEGADLLTDAGLVPGAATTVQSREAPADPAELAGTFASSSITIGQCVDGVTDADRVTVVAVDVATFEGKPAAVVILRPEEATALDVVAVALTCSEGDAQVLSRASVTS